MKVFGTMSCVLRMSNFVPNDQIKETKDSQHDVEENDEDSEQDDHGEEVKISENRVLDDGRTAEVTFEWLVSLLKRKFYYAGGSARYMFDYSMDELIGSKSKPENSVLRKLADRMTSDEWSSFAELKIAPSILRPR